MPAQLVVDISPVIDTKAAMLAAHATQREWLRQQHGEDEYLHWMRRLGAARAARQGLNTVSLVEPRFDLAHSRKMASAIAAGDKSAGR